MKTARVIGAGLSGLAAAWCLSQRGVDVEVIEAAPGPGGLIHTRVSPHGLVETAANAFVWSATVARWFRDLDLTPCFPLPSSRARYIWRDGRPRRWPLSIAETASMAARWSRAALTRSTKPGSDETVARWSDRVFGAAATRQLLGPALAGIYASSPDRLSAPLVIGRRRRRGRRQMAVQMAAPERGMGQFVARLHERLAARGVAFKFGVLCDRLDPQLPTVIATGAPAAARLLAIDAPEVAAALARVQMLPLATATMFFRPSLDDAHGFGVLFPRESGIDALGVLFNTDIFPGRATCRSETWIYGSTRTTADVVLLSRDRVLADRERMTSRRDEPFDVVMTSWPEAVPCYDTAITHAESALARLPAGVTLAGNYLGQIGVSALLEQAERAVTSLAPPGAMPGRAQHPAPST